MDLCTKWNLLWADHQRELLRQLSAEPSQVVWLDPPGASTLVGSDKDRALTAFVVQVARAQVDAGRDVAIDTTAISHILRLPGFQEVLKLNGVRCYKYP